jgi:hypothetical protein
MIAFYLRNGSLSFESFFFVRLLVQLLCRAIDVFLLQKFYARELLREHLMEMAPELVI